ncbi:hypothetical protein V2J09_021190 [Rumex salicifolius]
MAVLPLPVSTCEKIDITKPKEFGGLGIKSMEELNLALIGNLAWHFLHAREELWARAIRSKYIRPSLIERSDPSQVWRAIHRGVGSVVCKGSSWLLGNGRLIRFWSDIWVTDRSLKEWAISEIASSKLDRRVREFWTGDMGWRWDNFAHLLPNEVVLRIVSLAAMRQTTLLGAGPRMASKTVSSAYKLLIDKDISINAYYIVFKSVWSLSVQERVRTFMWSVIRGAILTNAERKI